MHLVNLIGPPAVGKMTVGQEITRRTTYRLFHNHMSIEPFLGIFGYGTPSFDRLRDEMRARVLQEAVVADLPGLVFTFVWAFDLAEDAEAVRDLVAPLREGGHRVDFVELTADLSSRLAREGTPNRVAHKRSKADRAWAVAHNRDLSRDHVLNSADLPDGVNFPGGHVMVDTSSVTAAAAAEQIIDLLGLPRTAVVGRPPSEGSPATDLDRTGIPGEGPDENATERTDLRPQ